MKTPEPIRILIIDDNTAIHEDFRKIFASHGGSASYVALKTEFFDEPLDEVIKPELIIDSAYQGEDGIALVKRSLANNQPYTVTFVDVRMPPGLDGVETIQKIWEIDPYIQTVICTAFADYSWEDISKKLGVTDRLLILKKPFDNLEVQQCTQTLIRKFQLTKEVREQIKTLHSLVNERTKELEISLMQLEHNATHDVLTDLPNRTLFYDRLNQIIIKSRSTHLPFAVLFMDINRFKQINDTLGHSVGDLLLQEIAQRLNNTVNDNDTVARFGGDEFIILLTTMHTEQSIIAFMQKLIESISQPFHYKQQQLFITPSIGITIYPKDGNNSETLIKNADIAMYQAKKLPHKHFQFYSEEINTHALEQLEIENDLLHAVEQNNFLVHYQPLVNLATGKIVGMEALLRWHHPKLGLVPPQKFIPIAEETGLIVSIGEWVLQTACAQTKKWQEQGLPHINIAVNVSALQMQEIDAVSVVKRVLDNTQLDAQYLELELTESTILSNTKEMSIKLKNLKKMGVKLVIDDFGTGYSSLSYLGLFPIDKIKIDQSFISNISLKQQDTEILLAIIAIGHALNLQVLAEGVETEIQLEFLRKNKCDEIQGEFLSRPLSVEAATALMSKKKLKMC